MGVCLLSPQELYNWGQASQGAKAQGGADKGFGQQRYWGLVVALDVCKTGTTMGTKIRGSHAGEGEDAPSNCLLDSP